VQNCQKKEEGVQNRTIDKRKIGGNSAIKHKKVHLTREGAKHRVQNRSKKRRGAKSHNSQKDREKSAIKPSI